jgi:hypothetical protein
LVYEAAENNLYEVVTEAICRGATWAQVGEQLNIGSGRTGAQKRFGKRVGSLRQAQHPVNESALLGLLMTSWAGGVPDSLLGFDSEYWDAAPPDVCAHHALRNIAGASAILDETLRSFSVRAVDGARFVEELRRSFKMLVNACSVLITPQVMSAIETAIADAVGRRAWIDELPGTYFVRSICLANVALRHFNKFMEWLEDEAEGREEVIESLGIAQNLLEQAVVSFSRPECMEVVLKMEAKIAGRGDAVYHGTPPDRYREMFSNHPDDMAYFFNYWRSNEQRFPDQAEPESWDRDDSADDGDGTRRTRE